MSVLNSGTHAATPAHANISNEKDIMEHVEKGDMDLHVHDEKHDTTNADALAAENAEKQLGVMDSLRMYPAAVAWSVGISLCIIMEGMDLGRESCAIQVSEKATSLTWKSSAMSLPSSLSDAVMAISSTKSLATSSPLLGSLPSTRRLPLAVSCAYLA